MFYLDMLLGILLMCWLLSENKPELVATSIMEWADVSICEF